MNMNLERNVLKKKRINNNVNDHRIGLNDHKSSVEASIQYIYIYIFL